MSQEGFHESAQAAASFYLNNMREKRRQAARRLQGSSGDKYATLDGYAFRYGLIELYEATFNPEWFLNHRYKRKNQKLFANITLVLYFTGNDVDISIRGFNAQAELFVGQAGLPR
jgi:uncharacterized protein YyaL (SSP411 family)